MGNQHTKTAKVQGTEESTNLFDSLYENGKAGQKAVRKDLAVRTLKRKFQSAIDSTEINKDEAEAAQHDERAKLQDADLNKLAQYHIDIINANETAYALKEEYKAFFNEEYTGTI